MKVYFLVMNSKRCTSRQKYKTGNSLSLTVSSMFIFLVGLGNSFRMRDKIQVFFFLQGNDVKIA